MRQQLQQKLGNLSKMLSAVASCLKRRTGKVARPQLAAADGCQTRQDDTWMLHSPTAAHDRYACAPPPYFTPPAYFKMRFIRCSKVASFVALLLLCMARPGLPLSAKNANSSAAVKFVLIVSELRGCRQILGRGRQGGAGSTCSKIMFNFINVSFTSVVQAELLKCWP